MKKSIKFTKQGYEDKQKEYTDLQAQRVGAVKELTIARDMGDRSENGAYKAARFKLSSLDRRIRQLDKILRIAEVIEYIPKGKVDIGSLVTVDDGNGEKEFTIVGGYESDLSKGRLSNYSPIGRALIGHKAGDIVTVRIPIGTVNYTIISIK